LRAAVDPYGEVFSCAACLRSRPLHRRQFLTPSRTPFLYAKTATFFFFPPARVRFHVSYHSRRRSRMRNTTHSTAVSWLADDHLPPCSEVLWFTLITDLESFFRAFPLIAGKLLPGVFSLMKGQALPPLYRGPGLPHVTRKALSSSSVLPSTVKLSPAPTGIVPFPSVSYQILGSRKFPIWTLKGLSP